jgi:transcriptional regulator with XRE-family HTH domain
VTASHPSSGKARALLLPGDAGTVGVRMLREILRRQTFGAVAKRVGCDEERVRQWAREESRPSRLMRVRAAEVLGIPGETWDEAVCA